MVSLVPMEDVRGSAPCPSYLVCPSVGPAGSSASPSARTGEAGAGANRAVAAEQVRTGILPGCRVTPEPGAVSQGGWIGWHHGLGTVHPCG